MPSFSDRSLRNVRQCEKDLQDILFEAIKIYDFTVITGHRGQEEQDQKFREGKSKLRFPHSKHNSFPSKAVDIAPFPIDWKDLNRFYYLAGIIKAIAFKRNINIRWGGDWDSDNDFKDNRFNDLLHFELA